jgi:WhiB family redox-sensing transcriptional regulator
VEEALREHVVLPCRRVDPELFFSDRLVQIEWAKAVCQPCPVRADCLTVAIRRGESQSVWGGEYLTATGVIGRRRGRTLR